MAEAFNNYFVEVARILKSSIVSNSVGSQADYSIFLNHMEPKSLFFSPISPSEIICYINSLSLSNSSDIDGVSNFIVKKISNNIAYIIAHIFNCCLEQGIFPDCLKTAIVIPLHKKGEANVLNNYRPISLLSVFSKIFEKCIKARLLLFLNGNNFFANRQFGFREGRGTEQALSAFMNDILIPVNSDDNVSANFIDLTKAFDTVDHELLLYKMWYAGIRGIAHDWFRSYLCNRTQIVKISDKKSNDRLILCGVPQGSVLGPILFLIYINSLFFLNLKGNMVGFADDVAIIYRGDSQNNIVQQMNSDLLVLRSWLDRHYMILSSKTNAMFFKLSGEHNLNLDIIYHSANCFNFLNCDTSSTIASCTGLCCNIDVVQNFKYLGVTFDHRLNFKTHIENVQNYVNICNRNLFLLRLLCPAAILVNIYYNLIQSKIQYGITIWGGIYLSSLNSLIVAQNISIRIICRVNRLTSALPLFRNYGILPLRYLYVFKVLKVFS